MRRSREEINKALNRLLDKASKIAMADGIITDEEREVLEELKVTITKIDYGSLKALDSDLSEVEFRDLLDHLQKQIFEALSERLKEKKGKITEQQQKILQLLLEKGLLQSLSE